MSIRFEMLTHFPHPMNVLKNDFRNVQNWKVHYLRFASKWIQPDGKQTDILIYNPVAQSKVPFVTKSYDFISWYVCGPTVYDSAHVGHAW